jgi:hypothetical protein
VGSSFDLAGEASVRLNFDAFSMNAQFDRVQPGFYSMGLPYLRSDQQSFRIQPRLRLLSRRLNLGLTYGQSRNNLLGSAQSTLERTQMGSTVQARLGEALVVSGNYLVHVNENQASPGVVDARLLHQKHLSHSVGLTPVVTLQRPSGTHSVMLTGAYQTMVDRSLPVLDGDRAAFGFSSYMGTVSYNVTLNSGLTLTSMANAFQSARGPSDTRVVGVNVGSGYGFWDQKLRFDVIAGVSTTETNTGRGDPPLQATQWTGTTNGTLRLATGNSVRLSVRGFSNATGATPGAFREGNVSLRYEHRF